MQGFSMRWLAGAMRGGIKLCRFLSAEAVVVSAVVFGAAGIASAQQLPSGITADQLMKLQQKYGTADSATETEIPPATRSQQTIVNPSWLRKINLPSSRLEQIMSERAGTKLEQFGYDQFGVGQPVKLAQVGGVQDSYILGPGDEIVVSLRGQENAEYRATVDRDGRVVLPRMNPVSAGGRSFGDFKRDLIAAIHRAYVSSEGYVSVGQLRQISVLVSGEVNNPGQQTLTGLSTVADAIQLAGGIKKIGSLRNVRVIRGGRTIRVDLYGVLSGEVSAKDATLADGDRVVVPPLGATVAVVGWVRRPGIYEIARGQSTIGVREVLVVSGGMEVRGKYGLSVLRLAADGKNQMVNIDSRRGVLHDSEILFVQPGADQTVDRATLSGGTSFAGQYVAKNTNLSQLLKSPGALGENPYTLFGLISRRDPNTKLRKLIAFTPIAILNGREDMQLKSDDIVRVFSVDEARRLFAMVQKYNLQRELDEEAIRNPQAAAVSRTGADENTGLSAVMSAAQMQQQQGNTRNSALEALRSADDVGDTGVASGQSQSTLQQGYTMQQGYPLQQGYPQMQDYQQQVGPLGTTQSQGATAYPSQRFDSSVSNNMEVFRLEDLARQIYVDPLVLINFLEDRSVNIDGAVRGPGLYLIGSNVDIRSVLEAAGGVMQWADRRAVEVISTVVDTDSGKSQTDRKTVSLLDASSENFFIAPHDGIRVQEVYTKVGIGSVTVQGEVHQAGTYQIVRGEHLSDVLQRAGGLTEDAYPYGTVFLRRSLAALEQDSYKRMAKQLQDQLILAMSRSSDTKLSPDAFTALQGYVKDLKNTKALGRMVVKADPAALKANPAADPLLEQGDVIFIPRQPFAVSVMGEVLQQNSVPYKQGRSASDYIDLAGGYSQFADTSEIFVILPDGSARRVEDSWFNFGGSDVPPGSTVYVGRDVSSYDTRQIILDITKIFAELATSAAAMAVLMENTKSTHN